MELARLFAHDLNIKPFLSSTFVLLDFFSCVIENSNVLVLCMEILKMCGQNLNFFFFIQADVDASFCHFLFSFGTLINVSVVFMRIC